MQSTPPDGENAAGPEMIPNQSLASVQVPRISIRFCTQCHWMLRAAYYAQELLSTFSTSLGEVALVPATGGVFTVDLTHSSSPVHPTEETPAVGSPQSIVSTTRLWDRKVQGGFPETKTLKKLVRDVIDPSRDLGHVDRPKTQGLATATPGSSATTANVDSTPGPLPELRGQVVRGAFETQKDQIEVEEAHSKSRSSKSVCEECP